MRGGKRSGAGRKAGAVTKKTRELADAAVSQGITPLEVMLGAMRGAWEAGNKAEAATFAKDAAPYIHPRLAAVEHSGNQDKPIGFQVISGVPRDADEAEAEQPRPN